MFGSVLNLATSQNLYARDASVISVTTSAPPALLGIFYTLQILGGQIGFPIVVLVITLRWKTLRGIHHPVFLNFYITWILSAFSFCLLLYGGKHSGPAPPYGLCLLQAVLGYAVPILTAASLWAVVFHLWLSVNHVLASKTLSPYHTLWLVMFPYALSIPYGAYPLVVGIKQPSLVMRAAPGFYCSVDLTTPSFLVAATALLLLILTTIFEVLVGIKLYKNRAAFRSVRIQGWKSVQLIIRLGAFHVYAVLAFVTCVEAMIAPTRLTRIFFQASLPTAAFLAFGTRPDIFARTGDTTAFDERPEQSWQFRSKGDDSNITSLPYSRRRASSQVFNHGKYDPSTLPEKSQRKSFLPASRVLQNLVTRASSRGGYPPKQSPKTAEVMITMSKVVEQDVDDFAPSRETTPTNIQAFSHGSPFGDPSKQPSSSLYPMPPRPTTAGSSLDQGRRPSLPSPNLSPLGDFSHSGFGPGYPPTSRHTPAASPLETERPVYPSFSHPFSNSALSSPKMRNTDWEEERQEVSSIHRARIQPDSLYRTGRPSLDNNSIRSGRGGYYA